MICVEEIVRQFSKFVKATKFLSVPDVDVDVYVDDDQNFAQKAILPFPF